MLLQGLPDPKLRLPTCPGAMVRPMGVDACFVEQIGGVLKRGSVGILEKQLLDDELNIDGLRGRETVRWEFGIMGDMELGCGWGMRRAQDVKRKSDVGRTRASKFCVNPKPTLFSPL